MKTIHSFMPAAAVRNMIISVVVAVASACGEPLMDYTIDTRMPVVEAYLQEGASSLTVKVYSMEVYLKDGFELSEPIGGLNLTINNRQLTETDEGAYILDLGSDTFAENQKYDLRFDHNGSTVEASATVPAPVNNLQVEPQSFTMSSSWYYWDSDDVPEVVVTWDDPDNDYYQVYIQSPSTTTDIPSLGLFGRRMMQPTLGNTYRATARDFRSAGTHWIYVYRVAADYVDLYERISSSDLANPTSSISNAFGIFTSLSVARVQVIVYEDT